MVDTVDVLDNEYFEWLYSIVIKDTFPDGYSYRKLLMYLHTLEYEWVIPKDENRAEDGCNLRYRFYIENNIDRYYYDLYFNGPCTVLEMLIALAIRCEEQIMDDPAYGDRTAQWFWRMIVNLGLGGMYDDRFDRRYVKSHINRFMANEYDPDGYGGLFHIRNIDVDLRNEEIWVQLGWYLNEYIL